MYMNYSYCLYLIINYVNLASFNSYVRLCVAKTHDLVYEEFNKFFLKNHHNFFLT